MDCKRWVKKELVLLACMVAAGATGVHFYQVPSHSHAGMQAYCLTKSLLYVENRASAPVKQVERLVKQAEQCVEEVTSVLWSHGNVYASF